MAQIHWYNPDAGCLW